MKTLIAAHIVCHSNRYSKYVRTAVADRIENWKPTTENTKFKFHISLKFKLLLSTRRQIYSVRVICVYMPVFVCGLVCPFVVLLLYETQVWWILLNFMRKNNKLIHRTDSSNFYFIYFFIFAKDRMLNLYSGNIISAYSFIIKSVSLGFFLGIWKMN